VNKGITQFITIFVSSLLLWLLLVGSLQPEEIIVGIIVSLLVSFLSIGRTSLFTALRLTPFFPLHLFYYLVIFFKALVFANLDMARRVISPSLPIQPGIIRINTGLESDLGKLLLANSITLTPGTLSVDIEDNQIVVHWIDCPENIEIDEATARIAASFEKSIGKFLK